MVRFFDLFLSILLLFLTCPLLVLISVGCLLVDGRPILFSQQRVGSKGEIFTIYKFRTMRQPNSMETVQQAHRELDRVTSFGKWLRNTKFDELPQLFNVLYGSMSLVGPRPHEYRQDAKFKEQIPDYCLRYSARPGITGLAQVAGLSGPIVDEDIILERTKADLVWVRDQSLRMYFSVLIKTIVVIIANPSAFEGKRKGSSLHLR